MKKWLLGFASAGIAIVILISVLALVLWANDVREDRKHVIVANSPTPGFTGEGTEACGGTRLTLLQPATNLRVRRIRYWKNCATVDVILPDGLTGHIVLGDGDVSVIPPLNAYK